MKNGEKNGLDAVFGIWTKEEAEKFNRTIDDMFEKIDPRDWK